MWYFTSFRKKKHILDNILSEVDWCSIGTHISHFISWWEEHKVIDKRKKEQKKLNQLNYEKRKEKFLKLIKKPFLELTPQEKVFLSKNRDEFINEINYAQLK